MQMDQRINLRKEQEASLERPHYKYSLAARFFFNMMDIITGRKITLSKTQLIEILATIPYRAWENRQYEHMTGRYKDQSRVVMAKKIAEWGREAQDNEQQHLLVINEKMKEDGEKEAWYMFKPIPFIMVTVYRIITRMMAVFHIQRAFLFNAEFEDHAEHVYAQFVKEHPEWEEQPVQNDVVKDYADLNTWADVFRRIGLDERNHRNNSFVFCGMPNEVVQYDGMPELPDVWFE